MRPGLCKGNAISLSLLTLLLLHGLQDLGDPHVLLMQLVPCRTHSGISIQLCMQTRLACCEMSAPCNACSVHGGGRPDFHREPIDGTSSSCCYQNIRYLSAGVPSSCTVTSTMIMSWTISGCPLVTVGLALNRAPLLLFQGLFQR